MSEKAEAYAYRAGIVSPRECWEAEVNGQMSQVLARLDILDKKVFPLVETVAAIERGCYCHRGEDENHKTIKEMAATIADLREKLEAVRDTGCVEDREDAKLGALVRQMCDGDGIYRWGELYRGDNGKCVRAFLDPVEAAAFANGDDK